jgi:organic hydroperoxide reductase OsmC/OhrA
VIYTAKTHTTGGRENGVSRSSDGQLEIKLSLPGMSGDDPMGGAVLCANAQGRQLRGYGRG